MSVRRTLLAATFGALAVAAAVFALSAATARAQYPLAPGWITLECPGAGPRCTLKVAFPDGYRWVSFGAPGMVLKSVTPTPTPAGGCNRPVFGPVPTNGFVCFLAQKEPGNPLDGEPTFDLAPGERWQWVVPGKTWTFDVEFDKPLPSASGSVCVWAVNLDPDTGCYTVRSGPAPVPGKVRVTSVDITFARRVERARREYRAREVSLRERGESLDRFIEQDRSTLTRAWTRYTQAARNVKALAAAAKAVEHGIRAAAANPALRAALTGQARALQDAMRAEDREDRRARSVYASAEKTLTDHLNARTIVERNLLTIAANTAPLEFALNGLNVSPAGGDPLYKVELRSSYDELEDVQRKIDELEQTLPKLRKQKAAAFADFTDARQETIRLLERMAGLTGKIMQVAVGKAAVSAAIHVGDFAKAWLLEGGPAGAFKEVLKKAAEAAAAEVIDTSGYSDPKDESRVVDDWMGEALDDTFGKQTVKVTLFERSYKELGINPALAGAEHLLDKLRQPLGRRAVGAVDASLAWSKKAPELAKQITTIRKRYERMSAYQRSMRKRLSGGAGFGAGVALELFKDFSEKYLTAALDNHERALWLESAGADQAARLWFSVYQASSRSYYDAKDDYEELLRDKAKLIATWDPNKGQRVLRSDAFAVEASSEMRITLDVTWPEHPGALPVQVLVNGKVLQQAAFGEYRLTSAQVGDATKLAIEIR